MTFDQLRQKIAIARAQSAGRESPAFVVLTVEEAEAIAANIERQAREIGQYADRLQPSLPAWPQA